MALYLTSPSGMHSDEEGEMPVLESTAAELGNQTRPRLPEISIISPGLGNQLNPEPKTPACGDERSTERVQVYLRIRPLAKEERERGEEQGCVNIQNEDTLLLKAPEDSESIKSAERGITPSVHKFTFSKIFGPETTQQEVFDNTMKKMVKDVLQGENRLLYTYGVTNSGKTYTIQGTGQETGLLPRALVSVFSKLQGRLYGAMDLKPVMYHDVKQLDPSELRLEEQRRHSLLKEDECGSSRLGGTSTTGDSGIAGLSTPSNVATQLEDFDSVCLDPSSLSQSGGGDLEEGLRFSVWVSFFEIYNEFLYDLLEIPPTLQPRKRCTLRLSDDKHGNPYVKDLTWVQVRSAEEAWRVLRAGRQNQSFASTLLNQNSSRSHSIFSIRVLHIRPEAHSGQAMRISELTVCDLAGSERCKDQRNRERMKEANNINTSLHTLGRCIAALRHNQSNRSRPPQVVPFRDSKLTRVLQGFFCGQGSSSMMVNINPCAGIYNETLQALKFSAIATQLVHGPSTKNRVAYILSLLGQQAQPSRIFEEEEEEEESGDDEELDDTMYDAEVLLQAIEVLRKEVKRQREEKVTLEANVRKEVVAEMMEVINKMQDDFSETLEIEKNLLKELSESKIKNLQKHLKGYYSQQLEERDQEIATLSAALERQNQADDVPVTEPPEETEALRRSQRLAGNVAELSKECHQKMSTLTAALEINNQADKVPATEPPAEAVRRSQRLAGGTAELCKVRCELDQCRAELLDKTQALRKLEVQLSHPGPSGMLTKMAERKLDEGQRNLRSLHMDMQRLAVKLNSGEQACCRNTEGKLLRQALSMASATLAKQNQTLVELRNNLQLVKAELRRKAESLAQIQASRPQLTPLGTPGSCKKRCAAHVENQPPEKRTPFHPIFPTI